MKSNVRIECNFKDRFNEDEEQRIREFVQDAIDADKIIIEGNEVIKVDVTSGVDDPLYQKFIATVRAKSRTIIIKGEVT